MGMELPASPLILVKHPPEDSSEPVKTLNAPPPLVRLAVEL